MNPDNTIEYNSLSWVKAQLDDVLSDAQASLNEYIENKTEGELENCIEHLQLIYGTLQMVEVYGAAILAEEMQLTTIALLSGDIDRAEDTYDVLMRAMLQLPDYLESVQAGKKDAPISLMPLINDLRAARKEGLLTESVLFSPDIESTELSSEGYDAAAIESGKLQFECKRLRTHYELGLLDFIRNNKEHVGLQRMKAVLRALEKVSSNAEVRRIWMVVGALVDGLLKQGIDTNLSIKMLLGTVDRQLKLILDNGEEEFARHYSKELVKNILFYVGLCTVDSKAISAVKEAYHLSDLIPQDSADSAVGGLNADLFDTVSIGITEDLVQVKDVLELFMYGNEQHLEQLVPVADQLGKIADTYGMLGLGATRQSIMSQRLSLLSIINGDIEISDKVVLDIASELLKAESELKDFIDSRSGFVDMNRNKAGEEYDSPVPAAEYRQVVQAVVAEGLNNFSEAKEAILSYVSGIGDKGQLDVILNRLEEVRGVSMMLPLGRVESLIKQLQNFIRVALLNNNHQVTDDEQNSVADVVTSIEYFFEALSEGRPGVEQGLNAGDAAAQKLDEIVGSYGDSVQSAAAEDAVEEDVSPEDDEVEHHEIKTAAAPMPLAQQTVEQYIILADDADEEIVEIFIEEAIEVLGELHEYLPQWIMDDSNEEALAVVRRSFHTLKGSGRLLGAEMIGEFSWKFENLLNRVIDKKINVNDSLFHTLDEALSVLPQLIEQLQGNREPIENISQLMNAADVLAEGRELEIEEVELPESASEEIAQNTPDDKAEDFEEVLELEGVSALDEIATADENLLEVEGLLEDEMAAEDETVLELEDAEQDIVLEEVDLLEEIHSEIELTVEDDDDVTDEEVFIEIADAAIDAAETETSDELSVVDISEEIEELDEVDESESVTALEETITLVDSEEAADDFDVESAASVEDEAEIESFVAEATGSEGSVSDSEDWDADTEYEVIIEEDVVRVTNDILDIDPMLLKIYYDESQGHIENIRNLITESQSNNQPLNADKDLMRAFHTLYGSARTAEVEPVADLSGAAEKYVKVRQESGEENIPQDVVNVLHEIEHAISGMLSVVLEGRIPSGNKSLHDKMNKIVQQEIQAQLQKPWQNSTPAEKEEIIEVINDTDEQDLNASADLSIDMDELSAEPADIKEKKDSQGEDKVAALADTELDAEEPAVTSYGDIDDELIDIFLEEADELLESCEHTLNDFRQTPNSTEHIQQLQRNMHTLKGGARMADLSSVGDLTHNLESLVVMVNENKVNADKALFDLLQESLDSLTNMLASVKQRQPVLPVNELNNRIHMLMRGEVKDKRSVERFDIELSELESDNDDELEEIDISSLLPVAEDASDADVLKQNNKKTLDEGDRPHWGERATDVNFKDSQEQVRVRSDLLNNLVNYAGEVNIYHARMGKQVTDFGYNLSELTQTVVRLKEQLRNLEIETEIQIRSGYEKEDENYDADFDPLEMDQYSRLQQLTRSLSETAGDVESINEILTEITRDSETLLIQESRVSTDLQEGLMRTRMVRFGGLSSRLRRIVRQVARELGKEVEVQITGEESEVDRTVLDRIIAPLEHMLRNAVAHGIESPEVRKQRGKSETGQILIAVDREGTDVVINIKDDGAGIDAKKVKEKAIKQGFVTADTVISDHDALQFILQSGFSTADEVTQVAGRGVGMDVVDSEIKQLGGVLDIGTVQGKGTAFNVRLPLTLAINQALLVSVGDDVFAVPLASIEGVVRMTGHELQRFYDSDTNFYEFNHVEYELKHLGGLLTGNQADYSRQLQLFPVLLVRVGDQHFALHVDDMLGRREIVVKPVGMQIGVVRGIAGATILADGRVVLILEMSALVVAESLFKQHKSIEVLEPVAADKKTIMVVDDSITIRKITERMLKRYGMDVVLAKDGVDATNLLQDSIPDLMLLDIEMPRMDGFEVATYVRNDDRLKNIPIIMITSRTGAKHKEKAMAIGVDEYLGKPFQEDELVRDINKILNTSF